MDPTSLIELIQTRLPQELTLAQIEEIRAKMSDSPALQEALWEELSLEQGLATRYAPTLTDFEAVIAHIEALATIRQRRHWLLLSMVVACSLAALVGGIALLVVGRRGGSEGGAVVAAKDGAGGAPRKGGPDGHPGPTTGKAAAAAKKTPGGSGTKTGGEEPGKPAPPGAPRVPAPRRMTWREYAERGSEENLAWRDRLGELFEGRHGRQPRWSRSKTLCELHGTFRLRELPAPSQMLRLGVVRTESCKLELWSGNEGVRIDLDDRHKRIEVQTLRRRHARDKPTVADTRDDRGAWAWYRLGAVDIRYQDGQILVCRGEVPLVRAPLAKPPKEASLVDAHVSVWLAEAKGCHPLPPEPAPPNDAGAAVAPAGRFGWQEDKSHNEKDRAAMRADPDGSVSLSTADKHRVGKAWFTLDAPPGAGTDVVLHVAEHTPRTAVYVKVAGREFYLWPEAYKSRNVVIRDRGHREQMEEDVQRGLTVSKEFRVRVRLGRDCLAMWVSDDGKRWWQRHYSGDVGSRKEAEIGLLVAEGDKPRKIAVERIGIRRFDGLSRLVKAELLAQARSAVTDEALKASKRPEALAALAAARPKGQDLERWQMACDAVLLARSEHWGVREDALWHLLQSAARQGENTDVAGVLSAVDELREITRPDSAEFPAALAEVFDTLGRTCLESGRREALKAVVDASYLRGTLIGMPSSKYFREITAQGLMRLYLLDLTARYEWRSARLEALRFLFLTEARWTGSKRREERGLRRLASWVLAKAQNSLGRADETALPEMPPQWMHPLVVRADSNMLNVIGEFLVLVHDKNYESACQTITRQTLENALVPLGEEDDLLESSHFKVREIIRTTPELQKILRDRHARIGMIRLKRARRQNDIDALKSLAATFYGTQPGFEAQHALADRDFSHGNFYPARVRYDALRSQASYPRRRDAAVKYRLASAMLGRLDDDEVTGEVVLPGKTFSAGEFERMVRRLARENRGSGVAAAADAAAAPPPARSAPTLRRLADAPPRQRPRSQAPRHPTAFTAGGGRLFVQNWGTLTAVDVAGRRRVWTYDPKRRSRWPEGLGAAAPLLLGDRLYARCVVGERPSVACFEADSGKLLWAEAYDDLVLSDPILIDSWLYVITGRATMSDMLELYLHRVSPDTGQSSLSSALVQVRGEVPEIGRPVTVAGGILFRAAGCLIHCDFRGVIRWVRRMLFVPSDVWREIVYDMPLDDMLLWNDEAVIFTSAGCPFVLCVDAATGRRLWSHTLTAPARLAGLAGDLAIVVEADRICALDPATGGVRWQRRCRTDYAGVLPAGADKPTGEQTLVYVRLDKKDDKRNAERGEGRWIEWLSAADGSPVRRFELGEPSLEKVVGLFSDGKWIYGLSNFAPRKEPGKVFVIEPGR